MVLLVSCSDIDEDINLILKCNDDDVTRGLYRLDYAFYQNDSLYILHGEGTDVYSLPIKCEDKRRKLRSKCTRESCEQFVLSFDFSLRVFEGRNTNDFLYFRLQRNDTTLWSCSEKDIGQNILAEPILILNDSLVVTDFSFPDKFFDDSYGDAFALVDNNCRYNLLESHFQYPFGVYSSKKSKYIMFTTRDSRSLEQFVLLFNQKGLAKLLPAINLKYNYNSGSFYSDSVLLSITGGYNDRNVKIQKHQIINDTLRLVEYLPYELYFDDYVNTVRDYIFPCGDDACLYRYDKKQVEKIKYK